MTHFIDLTDARVRAAQRRERQRAQQIAIDGFLFGCIVTLVFFTLIHLITR